MRSMKFLSLDETSEIHQRLIDTFGGVPGLRDKGLLESALFRPQTGYYEDLAQMAAALFESLHHQSPVRGRQQTHGLFFLRCLSAPKWLETRGRVEYRI